MPAGSVGLFREAAAGQPDAAVRPDRYARQTAADRPGVAQPVPVRPVAEQPWGKILLGVVALLAVLVGGWEWYWRDFGVKPSISNTYGLWAIQRRRIDAGEGDATVLLGASRMYFDVQLPVWERFDGRRPIQLSFEGTSPLAAVEDLAADPNFTGRILIAVEPDLFFSGYQYRSGAIRYARKESPSQRIGQWLSMHFIEPFFAFDDPDYALQTVLARQPWPERPGMESHLSVRKLAETEADRNTHLWSKVSEDLQYRELVRRIWRQDFQPSDDDPPPEEARRIEKEQIDRMANAVAQLRARGVKVLFVRMPSTGEYLAYENQQYPRARGWAALLAATGAPGIHFEDYPQLQGYYLPEWSHMTRAEGERFTAALYGIITRDFWGPGSASGAVRTTSAAR
ncbi:MAG TPA: hypothetical protein VGY90_05920 [Steroidobacteraceae bacterium]|jgi:hypothetical protein|nr:hypothetical protein [Steroidobacteraceae bacterium]